MSEISSVAPSARLTPAVWLAREVQARGEWPAWILAPGRSFFPPDVAKCGVDLAALTVARVPRDAIARAADRLLRSGAFGLLVLDMGERAHIPMPLQARLVALAQRHEAMVLCLTHKKPEEGSLGSLVSLRLHASMTFGPEAGAFRCRLSALKDKRRGPGWEWTIP